MNRRSKRAERIHNNRTIRSVPRAKRCQRAIYNRDWDRAEALLVRIERDFWDPPAVVYLRTLLSVSKLLATHTHTPRKIT
jgi:hypothetical protein